MSKFRTLLGGIAAAGIFVALGAVGVSSASSTGTQSAKSPTRSLAESSACFACVDGTVASVTDV